MGGTGLGTSLFLIAAGAVLAFAINVTTTGINLNTIGVILMVVGIIGLLFSLALMGDVWSFGGRGRSTYVDGHEHVVGGGERVVTSRTTYRDDAPAPEVKEVTRTEKTRDL